MRDIHIEIHKYQEDIREPILIPIVETLPAADFMAILFTMEDGTEIRIAAGDLPDLIEFSVSRDRIQFWKVEHDRVLVGIRRDPDAEIRGSRGFSSPDNIEGQP